MGQVITQDTLMARREGMREFFDTTDFDKLPDLETAKKLTDAADRLSPDHDETDEPEDATRKGIARQWRP